MYCAGWWGPHFHWFWITPLIFMVLMFVCCGIMWRRAGSWRWSSGNRTGWGPFGCWQPGSSPMSRSWSKTPSQILDQRYASGEITREQYEQMKRDIESDQPRPGTGVD
ncbi:SHOCT domain-containing protein [Candidatus Eisenbacteria bacterium]|uniref:SHOCT domain-containing protein n=1 Tax=Eiseniibacteriota bacterium TaxID=2212470 RepID=A0ABV6YIJ2_UNCEI